MKKISDLDIAGKTVLLRADFNVPLAKDGSGVITDDGRIVASLPTINALIDAGAKVVIVAHLGRPKGVGFEESGSLAPVAKRLGELARALVDLLHHTALVLELVDVVLELLIQHHTIGHDDDAIEDALVVGIVQ